MVRARGTSDEVFVEVANRGPVLPTTLLDKLFQPLQRGDQDDRGTRSIGLGLFISQEIAAAHGGRITVRSNESEGTLFTVRLPRT
jgi:signal transduction histidine kinase